MITLTQEKKDLINSRFSDNALKVMKKRYLLEYDDGGQETPADMYKRVAEAIANVENQYGKSKEEIETIAQEFFEIIASKEYTPAGRTLTNAGGETPVIANCVVLPIHDSMESIFQTLKDSGLLQQAGCGLGFDFSELRPAGSPTKKSRGIAGGPVCFLQAYDKCFGLIKQQGRTGANMAMMRVDHPDVLDFMHCKEKEGDIRNFNISVTVTDEFMEALETNPDQQWYCTFNGKRMKPRRVLRHANDNVYGTEEVDITVQELFDELVEGAYTNGEPGIAFVDTWNRANPLPDLGPLACTNPCGEQTLHPYDNCNLGSINLALFVKDGQIEWERLRFVTRTAVRLMDNVVDMFDFPVKAVTELAHKNRRIGLGIMGFADMLYQLKIGYDSPQGLKMGEQIMELINKEAYTMSQELAEEKGEFPNYQKSVFAKQTTHSQAQSYGIGKKMRNAALTTVAPTGSISMMFDCSSGVEPFFALAYIEQDKDGMRYQYFNKYLEKALNDLQLSAEEVEEIKKEVVDKGTIQHLTNLPQELRDVFVVAMDISGKSHMEMQAAFQRHVDNSISKTINLPNEATREDIAQSFVQAWKLGCKSCTVYREGSRVIQILNVGKGDNIVPTTEDPNANKQQEVIQEAASERGSPTVADATNGLKPRPRPDVMSGKTYRIKTGYGNLYVTINDDQAGKPFEVFTIIGKNGGFMQEQSEAICRLMSLALRAGVAAEEVADNLKGIRGPMPIFTDKGTILSLPDAIGKILEEHLVSKKDQVKELVAKTEERLKEVSVLSEPNPSSVADFGLMPGCPDCGDALVMQEGCVTCKACGYNRCS